MASEPGREKILDAARSAFGDLGYDGTSIAEIAKRARIAKSVIFHHFGSKAGLYLAIIEAETQGLVDHVAATVAEIPDGRAKLRAGLGAYFTFIEEHPAAWRILVREAPAEPELVAAHRRLGQERSEALSDLLAPARAGRGRGHKERKQLYAELLTTAIRSFASWWYDNPSVSRDDVLEATLDFALSGARRLLR